MVMTEACEPASMVGVDGRALQTRVHDRMPAILPREDWGDWLDGPPDAAGLLCRPYELGMMVERTDEAWVRR
jgi:putative SOS response-associated peptidase YedK